MCTRIVQHYEWWQVLDVYGLTQPRNLQTRYNVAPTDDIDIVVTGEGGNDLVRARWGLIPAWWQKPLKDLPATFNARAESVADRPMFRDAFRERRCVVPASGFFEWTGPKAKRQPWYVTPSEGPIFSFAGLWDRWRDPETSEWVVSATIIVCDANPFMSRIHSRMPVILAQDAVERWLQEPDGALLKPAPDAALRAWPVSPKVNSVRYQEPDTIAPFEDRPADQPTLF